MKNIYQLIAMLAISSVLSSCDNSTHKNSTPAYQAEITRTEYGIPHIKAEDWGSLGYGHGYSYAQDNFCVLLREIVFARGQSAELLGQDDGDIDSDFIFQLLNGNDELLLSEMIDPQPQYLKELVEGYAQGMNRYLDDTGIDNLPEGDAGCRNAGWASEITSLDMWKYMRKIALQGSSDNGTVRKAIIDATGPENKTIESLTLPDLKKTKRAIQRASEGLKNTQGGSNAIALGRDATQSGTGMLLGNPHQPWQGSGRWYQVHLTIPGEYNVMGATLQGLPMVGIGFNEYLAWTHTVSFANRFTLYELPLNPENPMQYRYDDEWRDLSSETVQAKIKLPNGTVETREHTFYQSHYGPIINLGSIDPLLNGWPMLTGSILSIRDANINNVRGVDQWVKMGQAKNMVQFIDALKLVANPLFHTLAADRDGNAFYGDISAIPHVTQNQLDNCINGLIGPLLAQESGNTILSLDGSNSNCEWGSDEDSPDNSNLYGYSALPKFVRNDYAANSNNSYWLSNANYPLTGFPVVMGAMGHEGEQQFTRTQLTHQMVAERMNASDGLSDTAKFNLDTLQQLMYSNRVLGAETSMADIQTICDATRNSASSLDENQQRALRACDQLALWDQHVNLTSEGAHVFTEFWKALQKELDEDIIIANDELWAVDFDAADPIHTPRGFDTTVNENHQLIITALSNAVIAIENANLALNAPFSEVQFFKRDNDIIPIHGGYDDMGVFGVIKVRLEEGGYQNITGGNSYIQAVTWDDSECPIAEGILTHSQSTNPASPHYGDQTTLYSDKNWVSLPFCTPAITATQIGEMLTLKN